MSLTSKELNEILNKTRRTPNISLTPEQVEELIKDLEELQRLREKEIAEMQFDVTKYCLKNIGFEYTNLKLENEKLKQDLEILEAIKNKAQNNRFFKGCLLRMFCETKKTPNRMNKEKIKDKNYDKIMRWLDEKSD